jgi:hypothetical protein
VTTLTQYHIQRFGTLRTNRSNWNIHLEEAASRIIPAHRNTFIGGPSANAGSAGGQKKTEEMFDATAAFAAQRFSSVIESLVTPKGSTWHRLVPVDKMLKRNRAVRLFFDELNDLLFSYRYRPVGNFVGNSQQVYLGLGVYGNGVLYVDKPEKTRGLRYRNIHLGEAYFVENHAGVVDTLYRWYSKPARSILQEFGDACPAAIKEAATSATNSNKEYEILHCVYPREDADPQRVDPKGMPFASLYILVVDQSLLSESGYHTFPFAVSRYTQASGEVYGRGPAQHVLPSIKVLNQQKKDVLRQGHRVLDPVLLAHDDGNLGSFSLKAGALNAGGISKDGKRLIDVLPTGNLAVGHEMMDIEKAIINDAFLITLFQILVDTPQMTATEVLERAKEKGMLLAPTAGRIESEFLGPLIERELDLMARQGIWPKNVPTILQDAEASEFKIEYDSPMSRMQRSERAAGFMRSLDVAANYAKMTGDMTPLDWLNFDTAMPEILDIQGAPTSWTRSIDEVTVIRDGRAQAKQQQQMIDAAPALASVVKSVPAPK